MLKKGVNKYIFWVSNNLMEDWYELPDVSEEQIRASREFKYFLTGNLESPVLSARYFPGKEAHLLKCQIVRILHGSFVVPNEYLKIKQIDNDDNLKDRVVEFNEESNPYPHIIKKSPEEMKTPESWVHENDRILKCGRIIHSKEENEDKQSEKLTNDPYSDRLSSITNDKLIGTEDKINWNLRVVGDSQQFNPLPPNDTVSTYDTLVVTNYMIWPGYTCAYKGGEFVSIYIGFGIKYGGSLYLPTEPGNVTVDVEGTGEFKEPNEPPKKIEEKKDDELNQMEEMMN